MGLEGEGSGGGGRGGGKWGERGREVGIGYPLSTPSIKASPILSDGLKDCSNGQ